VPPHVFAGTASGLVGYVLGEPPKPFMWRVHLARGKGGHVNSVHDVFGVRKEPILSYVERPDVDQRFLEALKSDRHVIVYGASKQGKSALVERHLPREKVTPIHCAPETTPEDIYQSILRQEGVRLETGTVEAKTNTGSMTTKVGFRALLPFATAGGGVEATAGGAKTVETTLESVPFNLSLAQDVGEILHRIGFRKVVLLENFHYLNETAQKALAFDLRTFQEIGVRFVVLGIWREKNRLAQFNGDLLDRMSEVPVEPWKEEDFDRAAHKGCEILNVQVGTGLFSRIKKEAYGSIAVVQELLKELCINAGVLETQRQRRTIDSEDLLLRAILKKVEDYRARHLRSLEAIASGRRVRRAKDGTPPLFIPFYTVRAVLSRPLDQLFRGISREDLRATIQSVHHRADDVRSNDLSNFLLDLALLQKEKGIAPPILDYDGSSRQLKIIDSTMFFFLHNTDRARELESIPNPMDAFDAGDDEDMDEVGVLANETAAKTGNGA
jgi:histone H3/H4